MTDTPRVFLAEYHDGLSTRHEVVPEGAMGAEEWEPKGSGVRVKPLEWEHLGGGFAWRASSGFSALTYRIEQWDDGFHVCFSVPGSELETLGNFLTLEAAKAAAQADYEARIRAALELTTEPEPTSGAYDLICCTAEDVVQGRSFTGDAVHDLTTAQESLRACLKLLGWRG